ncbi:hypothetical protein HDV00_004267 [Rhizophlyctis rosea]|nr:hypothetical protein HDV00_004267 [Rhizophlyctis rosea]
MCVKARRMLLENATLTWTVPSLQILLDTTIGVGILYLVLKLLHSIVDYYRVPDMQSGHYGHPPRLSAWARQLTLFIFAWFIVKLLVVLLLQLLPILATIATYILSPLERSGDTRLQVIVVMLIFPLIMNIIQAWLIDMVIKGKGSPKHGGYERVGDDEGDEEVGRAFGEGDDLIEDLEREVGDWAVPSGDEAGRSSGESVRSGSSGESRGGGEGKVKRVRSKRSGSDGDSRSVRSDVSPLRELNGGGGAGGAGGGGSAGGNVGGEKGKTGKGSQR